MRTHQNILKRLITLKLLIKFPSIKLFSCAITQIKKITFSFNNMVNSVYDNYRRRRDDDCNFILPTINFANLHHFLTPKLDYNWNNLPVTIKSVSQPIMFRTERKQHLMSSYQTTCTKHKCYSCQTPN